MHPKAGGGLPCVGIVIVVLEGSVGMCMVLFPLLCLLGSIALAHARIARVGLWGIALESRNRVNAFSC